LRIVLLSLTRETSLRSYRRRIRNSVYDPVRHRAKGPWKGPLIALACTLALVPVACKVRAEEEPFAGVVEKTEEIRGFSFERPVSFERMSKEDLVSFLQKELSRQYSDEDWRLMQSSLVLLGAIPKAMELDRFMFELMGEQVAGLYDPHTKKMYVVGNLSLEVGLTQVILEHELTHALTDQRFDLLSLPIEEIHHDDRTLAALALVEGDATVSMVEYTKGLDVRSAAVSLILTLFLNQDTFQSAPSFLQAWLLFPYLGGEVFLLELMTRYRVENGSLNRRSYSAERDPGNPDWQVVDRLYDNPPVSTEQILHPEKYVHQSDAPVEVDLSAGPIAGLGPDWSRKWENTMGEFLIETLFSNSLSPLQAHQAAEGWGGDRYLLAEDTEGRQALYWRTVWDTEEDADQFRDACQRSIEKRSFGGFPLLLPKDRDHPKAVSLWICTDEATAQSLPRRDEG